MPSNWAIFVTFVPLVVLVLLVVSMAHNINQRRRIVQLEQDYRDLTQAEAQKAHELEAEIGRCRYTNTRLHRELDRANRRLVDARERLKRSVVTEVVPKKPRGRKKPPVTAWTHVMQDEDEAPCPTTENPPARLPKT